MSREYNDMFRPVFEAPATASWGASSLAIAALQPPWWPVVACGAVAMTYIRAREAFQIYRFRASLSALRVQSMAVDEAVSISRKHWEEGGLWIGNGFNWTQKEAETARQIMWRSPGDIPGPPGWFPKPLLKAIQPADYVPIKKDAIGSSWIHGINPDEHQIRLPIDALPGHTLIAGTTRAGKTKLYELLTTQIIHLGKTLIVIDPKGDKDLLNRMRSECKKAGRKFLYFHPAHPSKSIRINPLQNFNSKSEPAGRIGQLIDAEGTFGAFAWKTLYRIMRAQVADGTMPTIKAAKEYVQGGIEPLLERLLKKRLYAEKGGKWDSDIKHFIDATAPEKGKPSPIKSERVRAMIKMFEDSGDRDEAIESLISMINHSKEHYSKMIQVLEPILEMLGSDELGAMLSPDPLDLNDTRPIYDTQKIIEEGAVLYVGLDSLSNKIIGSAIGSILLADIAAGTGAAYNFGKNKDVYLFIDEAAEVMNEQAIQLLNKGGGAGIKAFIATQTIADFDAVFGSTARSRQALGNLNNVICLRIKDTEMAKWIAESFGKTSGRTINRSYSTGSGSSTAFTEFSGSTSSSLSETEIPLVSPDLLTRLPGLQYFAFLAGSTLYKGRLPVLH